MKVAIVGMSHLGVIYSIGLAERGFDVVGLDIDDILADELNTGIMGFHEPRAVELLNKHLGKKLSFSNDFNLIRDVELILIAQDTKTNEEGEPDYSKVENLISESVAEMSETAKLIILSQAYPGFTRKLNLGDKAVYQVETLIFGQAIERVLNPEQLIVGLPRPNFESEIIERYLSRFTCKVHKMSLESAELAKISINIQLTFSILSANLLATSAEISGADWNEVKTILKSDKRIGEFAYLSPNLGISGDNLPRDLRVLSGIFKGNSNLLEMRFLQQALEYNSELPYWIIKQLDQFEIDPGLIGVLGLSYKENTQSSKGSPALKVIDGAPRRDFICYDPQVNLLDLPNNATRVSSLDAIIKEVSVLIIATPWSEFRDYFQSDFFLSNFQGTVIDPFEILPRDLESHCVVIRRGRNQSLELS
jgi:UDPglucose 6-dehydrogenase